MSTRLTTSAERWERLIAQQNRLSAALVDAWDAVLAEDYDTAIKEFSELILMIADQKTLVKLDRDARERELRR